MKGERITRDLATAIKVREQGGIKTIVGLIPYNKPSEDLGGFVEVITPTAFAKTLADGYDVKALYGHDANKVLGRVKNGSLRLTSTPGGLVCECDLPSVSYADDAYQLIKQGYVTTMSFGFTPINERVEIINGQETHYLEEVKLYEVSFAVAFPAYPDTQSYARSIELENDEREALIKLARRLATQTAEPNNHADTERAPAKAAADPVQPLKQEPEPEPDTATAERDTAAEWLESLVKAVKENL